MLKILKIQAYNLFLFKELEIDFTTLSNIVFINGSNEDVIGAESNGSGKSLIGDIITDVLFDKTIRKHSVDTFIGRFDKFSISSIYLKDSLTKTFYTIVKFRNSPEHKNKIFFGKSSKYTEFTKYTELAASAKTKKESYEIISETLNLEWDVFRNRNFFGQDDPDRFLNVTDAKKAELLIEMQNLSDLKECKEVSNKELGFLKKTFEKKQFEVESHKRLVSEALSSVKSLKEDINSEEIRIKDEISKAESEIKSLNELSKKIDPELSSDEEKLLKNKKENLDIKIKDVIKETSAKIENLNKDFSKIEKVLGSAQSQIENLQKNIAKDHLHIEGVFSEEIKKCRLCGSELGKKEREKTLEILKDQLENNNSLLSKITISKTENLIKKSEIIKEKSFWKEKSEKIQPLMQEREKINEIIVKNSSIKSKRENVQLKINEMQSRINILLKKLDNPSFKNSLKSAMINAKKFIDEQKTLNVELEKLDVFIKKEQFAKDVFDRTIRILFTDFINNLNVFSAQYMGLLCDDSVSIKFVPQVERKSKKIADEISVSLSIAGQKPRPFKTYSGGEKARAELSTQIALFSSADNSLSLLWLDEPFHGVDYDGRVRMLDLLQKVSSEGVQVIVVSHEDIPFGIGDSINILRKNNESFLKV
jgi:ABC-type branched-subunit amino acid transport system ATPase component